MSSSNCRFPICPIEDWTARPAVSRDTAPHTPKIVMNMRVLYRKMLRAVTLCVKFRRFHSGGKCSKRIFEPLAGGLGSSRLAGFSRSSLDAASHAGTTALIHASANAAMVIQGWNLSMMSGMVNPALYAWATISGSSVWPASTPMHVPRVDAANPHTVNLSITSALP